jgi:transcriptional regulator with XRE-family HTH domain
MDPTKRVVEVARLYRLQRSGQAKRIREQAGITGVEMAKALGIRETTYWRWEGISGHQSRPRPEAALRWLALLDQLAAEQDDDQEELATASA